MSDPPLLTIGRLAARTGVATSALRYYEEQGLLEPSVRVSGHRRYAPEAVDMVGAILFLRDVGFTLSEIRELTDAGSVAPDEWRALAARKAEELRARLADTTAALVAVEHAVDCPKDDLLGCPNFWFAVGERLEGRRLADSSLHDDEPARQADPRFDVGGDDEEPSHR